MSSQWTSGELPVRIVRSGDARFTYLERVGSTPLVLLHGVGSAARSWKHQVQGLSSAFRVIAWDAPGYGGSTRLAPEKPDAGDYASALDVFLGAMGVGRFHLVGHSFGCVIAARYARLHPERILTLTLASIAGGHARLPEEERARLKAGRLDDLAALGARGMAEKRGPRLLGPHADEAAKRAVIETMAMIDPEGYKQAVHMLSMADTREDVRRLRKGLRVQIIFGDQDMITTPEQIRAIARERPDAPVHVLSGPGHALYLEQPETFNELLVRFMQESK